MRDDRRLTRALVAAAVVVPRSIAKSPGTFAVGWRAPGRNADSHSMMDRPRAEVEAEILTDSHTSPRVGIALGLFGALLMQFFEPAIYGPLPILIRHSFNTRSPAPDRRIHRRRYGARLLSMRVRRAGIGPCVFMCRVGNRNDHRRKRDQIARSGYREYRRKPKCHAEN